MTGSEKHDVIIVGGGAAGTLTAAQLRRQWPDADICLVERAEQPGRGVAYGTDDQLHLLNVPAARLSAFPDQPDHFLEWARQRDASVQPQDYLPRVRYSEYLRQLLAAANVQVTRGEAIAVRSDDDCHHVELADAASIAADALVLAIGHQPPALAPNLPADPRVFASPWERGALAPLPAGAAVLLVGSGLTAVDAALTLCAERDDARVVAISRSGQLPFPHLEGPLRPPADPPDFGVDEHSIDDIAATVTAHIAAVEAAGGDWRDAVDGMRPLLQQLWKQLPFAQQQGFLERYMRSWEVRRHRMAPAVAAKLEALAADGRFIVVAGTVQQASACPDGIDVSYGTARERAQGRFARVISCIGPRADITTSPDPLVSNLLSSGVVEADVHRFGFRADDRGRVAAGIYTLGSLRRGELWETTAIPEIRVQAQEVAAAIVAYAGTRSKA